MIPMSVAAGHVKLLHHAEKLLRVPNDLLESVTFGSYTPEPRPGNSGNVFWVNDETGTSLNALGLPNPGIDEAVRFLPEVVERFHDIGKKVRVSIAGQTVEEFVTMADKLAGLGIDEIEYNFGCPNVRVEGKQKPIFSFVPELMDEVLSRAFLKTANPDNAVKVSPSSNPFYIPQMAEVFEKQDACVQRIISCNTYPNGLHFSGRGGPVISANNGYAGVAGTALHQISVGQVRQLKDNLFMSSIEVVGVGGVCSGETLRNFELAGATSAQIGTAYFNTEDPGIFQEIAEQYVDLTEELENTTNE